MSGPDIPDELRERIRRAHIRLRKASQDYEVLVAPEPVRGRWDAKPAPQGALDAAMDELKSAYTHAVGLHEQLTEPET